MTLPYLRPNLKLKLIKLTSEKCSGFSHFIHTDKYAQVFLTYWAYSSNYKWNKQTVRLSGRRDWTNSCVLAEVPHLPLPLTTWQFHPLTPSAPRSVLSLPLTRMVVCRILLLALTTAATLEFAASRAVSISHTLSICRTFTLRNISLNSVVKKYVKYLS